MEKVKILLVLATLSVLWDSSFLAIKVVIDAILPLLVFGIRFVLPDYLFFSFINLKKTNNNAGKNKLEIFNQRRWKIAIVLGTLILGRQGLLVWGTQYLSSGMTALLNSTIPLWNTIISSTIYKQHLTKNMFFGLIAGFSGLVILVNPFIGNNQLSLVGIISLTLSSIFWAFGSLYSTENKESENIFASGGLLMIVGGTLC